MRVGWDRGILLKLARSQSCRNTEEEAWGSVRGPRQSLRSTWPACCPWRYTHLQTCSWREVRSGPPLTFWWTGQSWNDKPGRIHLWIKTDKQETKAWCLGIRDGSSVFSREHCRSLWMTYSPWSSAPAVQSRWPSNTFLTCWMSRRDNMVSLTQTLYTSGRPTGMSPSSNDIFMGRGVFKQHCGVLSSVCLCASGSTSSKILSLFLTSRLPTMWTPFSPSFPRLSWTPAPSLSTSWAGWVQSGSC